jgi:hypothetical protein
VPPGPRRIASRICPDLISDRHKASTAQASLELENYTDHAPINEIRGYLDSWRGLRNPADWGATNLRTPSFLGGSQWSASRGSKRRWLHKPPRCAVLMPNARRATLYFDRRPLSVREGVSGRPREQAPRGSRFAPHRKLCPAHKLAREEFLRLLV